MANEKSLAVKYQMCAFTYQLHICTFLPIWTVTLDINNILLNAHCFPSTVISRNRKILKFENRIQCFEQLQKQGRGGGSEGKVCAK